MNGPRYVLEVLCTRYFRGQQEVFQSMFRALRASWGMARGLFSVITLNFFFFFFILFHASHWQTN